MGAGGLERKVGLLGAPRQWLVGPGEQWAWLSLGEQVQEGVGSP